MTIEEAISRWGDLAIVLGTFLEGDTVAMTGGILAHRGLLAFPSVVMAAILGAFLWDMMIFSAGKTLKSRTFFQRVVKDPRFDWAVRKVASRRDLFAIAYRFIPGMRTVGPLALAASGMSTARFVCLAGTATIVWATLGVSIGFAAGAALFEILGRHRRLEHDLIAGIALAFAVGAMTFLVNKHILKRKTR